ncbi:MAG: hypothetical protein V4641_30460 [Pseudomonadota bacterium]
MRQLRLSDQITEKSLAAGSAPFAVLIELMQSGIKDKPIWNYPVDSSTPCLADWLKP